MEVATGVVSLTDNGRVVGVRPVVAAMPQRPAGPGEAVPGVHEAPALVPLHADVVVELGLLQGHGGRPGLLLAGPRLDAVTLLEWCLPASVTACQRQCAEEGGTGLLHLSG